MADADQQGIDGDLVPDLMDDAVDDCQVLHVGPDKGIACLFQQRAAVGVIQFQAYHTLQKSVLAGFVTRVAHIAEYRCADSRAPIKFGL